MKLFMFLHLWWWIIETLKSEKQKWNQLLAKLRYRYKFYYYKKLRFESVVELWIETIGLKLIILTFIYSEAWIIWAL